MAGRPAGSPNKDKPFRDALRLELAAAGEDHKALRAIAKNLIGLSMMLSKDALPAIKEIAERCDGKVPQAIVGDDSEDPIQLQTIERVIVKAPDKDR